MANGTFDWMFFVKTVVVPLVLIGTVGIASFAIGHTQKDGHPVMAERVNDTLVRVGRVEEAQANLSAEVRRIEIEGIDDRFRRVDAERMEAGLQEQLDEIRLSLSRAKVEIDRIKAELGVK